MEDLGKLLVSLGAFLVLLGGSIWLASRIPGVGRLPGDLVIQTETFSCFFPIASSIALSVILTIVLNLLLRIFNR